MRTGAGLEDGDWPVREEKACYGLFKVRKVGQIIVLAEWEGSNGQKKRIVLGPYWHFLLITLTVMSTITALIYASVLPRHLSIERSVGLGLSILALIALMCTAMSDPGIYPRHSKPLEDNWTYSEYAQSYRPAGVIYCQQCQVLIEEYNHFCPWSGIVIGKGNEPFFQVFITSTVLALMYDVVIVSMILHGLAF
jgi:hypothetical protein